MNKTVKQVHFPKAPLPQLKKVAAYARVSTGKDAMLHSLAAQVGHYAQLIQSHSGWQYVGVYADATDIIGLKQNPTYGRRFSPIFLFYRAFCGAKRKMLL